MFTLIVCQILLAGIPFERIHILCFFFASPKISHVHCSQSLSFDGIVCNTNGGRVVAVDRGFGLGMAEIIKGGSKKSSPPGNSNNAPNSALAADATTNRSIEHSV
jgi:hypothetical protein